MNTLYLFLSTQVTEGTVFRKHTGTITQILNLILIAVDFRELCIYCLFVATLLVCEYKDHYLNIMILVLDQDPRVFSGVQARGPNFFFSSDIFTFVRFVYYIKDYSWYRLNITNLSCTTPAMTYVNGHFTFPERKILKCLLYTTISPFHNSLPLFSVHEHFIRVGNYETGLPI